MCAAIKRQGGQDNASKLAQENVPDNSVSAPAKPCTLVLKSETLQIRGKQSAT
jgi:hypothetical protein